MLHAVEFQPWQEEDGCVWQSGSKGNAQRQELPPDNMKEIER